MTSIPSGVGRLLRHAAEIAAGGLPVEQALGGCLRVLCETIGWPVGHIYLVDPQADVLRPTTIWQLENPTYEAIRAATMATEFESGIGLPGRIWASGEPECIPDLAADTNFPRAAVAAAAGLRSALGAPVTAGSEVVAVLELFSPQTGFPQAGTVDLVSGLAGLIGRILERRSAESLQVQHRSRLQAMLDASLDAIVSMDAEGRVVDFNAAAEAIFGYSQAQAVGRLMGDLIVPEELRDAHTLGLQRYLQSREHLILGRRIELPAMRADGSQFPAELVVQVVAEREPPLFIGYVRDLSETRRLEQERAAYAESLRRANEELERFASVAAHDLQSPLRRIAMTTSMLMELHAEELGGATVDHLALIARQAQSMRHLVQDLLTYSRSGYEQASAETNSTPAADAVNEALDHLKEVAVQTGASIVVQDLPTVRCDRRVLVQVFQNLLENAMKYGGNPPEVTVAAQRQQDEWILEVRDHGPGVAPAEREQIFSAFTRGTGASAAPEGTGLGLSICRRALEHSGGRLWVEDVAAGGARFRFALPPA